MVSRACSQKVAGVLRVVRVVRVKHGSDWHATVVAVQLWVGG